MAQSGKLHSSAFDSSNHLAQKMCLFCYKTVTISSNDNNLEQDYVVADINRFTANLKQFTNNYCISVSPFPSVPKHFTDKKSEHLGCCCDCAVTVNQFCDEFHQLKCIELQTKWKLSKIANVIKLANRIPERVKRFKSHLKTIQENDDKAIDSISSFRQAVIHNSTKILLLSEPQVRLKRLKNASSCLDSSSNSDNGVGKLEFTSHSTPKPTCQEAALGWLMSFSAVALLAAMTCGHIQTETVFDEHCVSNTNDCEDIIEHNSNCIDNPTESDAENNDCNDDAPVSPSPSIRSEPEHQSVIADSANNSIHGDDSSQTLETEIPEMKHDPADTTSSSQSTRHCCKICSKTFSYVSILQRHVNQQHASSSHTLVSSVCKWYHCLFCKTSYVSYQSYRSHLLKSTMHDRFKRLYYQNQKLQKNVTEFKNQKKSSTSNLKTVSKRKRASSVMVNPQHSRYNLRAKRARSYVQVDQHEDDLEYGTQASTSGESSESEQTSSSDSGDESPVETQNQVKREPKIKKPCDNDKPSLVCRLEGCKIYFGQNLQKFEEHQKLHASGEFKCNFCEQIMSSTVKLANHERTQHPPRKISVTRRKLYYCPRCSYESQQLASFQYHFAAKHLNSFDFKKGKDYIDCKICQESVFANQQDAHFKRYHDITDISPDQVKYCKVQGCHAYFKNKRQRFYHKRKMHKNEFVTQKPIGDEDKIDEDEIREKGIFKCKICGRPYPSASHLLQHKRRYHRSDVTLDKPIQSTTGRYICPVMECVEVFDTLPLLATHHKLHGKFQCQFCPVEKSNAKDLALHEIEHIASTSSDSDKIKCSRCTLEYPVKGTYVRHFLKCHLSLKMASKQICKICQAEGSKHYLKHHRKSHHNIKGVKPEDILRCDLCPAYFLNTTQLNVHKVRIHWKNKCPECDYLPNGKSIRFATLLRNHLDRKHPHLMTHRQFSCSLSGCKQVLFGSQAELDKHIAKIHQTLQCSKCEKTFTSTNKLSAHYNNVHTDYSHICSECGKEFKQKYNLQKHMEYHKDPKDWKFECDICNKKCVDKYKLIEHQRSHTKEKPYICSYCGIGYAYLKDWRNHVKTKHPKEFEEMDDKGRKLEGNFISRKGSKRGDCLTKGVAQM